MNTNSKFWNDLDNGILPEVPISLENSTLIKLVVGIMVIMIIGIVLNAMIQKQFA